MHSLTWLWLVGIAFICGALPFSVWLGKLFLRVDIRQLGDGNPGATNVYRGGNKLVALLALLLDVSKAAAPVGIAYYNLEIRGIPMVMIALAPILGHVFSPFLRFRGGKGLATALGVWIGLTIWKASTAAVLSISIGMLLLTEPGWAVVVGLAGLLLAILAWFPAPVILAVWVGETVILLWTHRHDLSRAPQVHRWVKHLFERRLERY